MNQSLKEQVKSFNTVYSFIDFYNKFEGYKSEKRDIIENEYADGSHTYSISYEYKLVSKSWKSKGEAAIKNVIDPVIFNSKDETELYIKLSTGPIINAVGHEKGRFYLPLKDREKIKQYIGYYPEWRYNDEGNSFFGLYGIREYDKPSFKEFVNLINSKYKSLLIVSTSVLNSYDISELTELYKNEEIEGIVNERNDIIVKEIERLKTNIKFLQGLIKIK